MEDKEKIVDDLATRLQRDYNVRELTDPENETLEEKKFNKIITSNNLKQWIFVILTGLIIILAILDIFFGIGKLDKWVYLFGVVTAYEANEAREKNVITKEYQESRRKTRNIVRSLNI